MNGLLRILPALGLAALATTAAAAPAFAASSDAMTLRIQRSGSLAHVVFDWEQPVAYRLYEGEGELSVIFDRPFESDLGALGNLSDLLSSQEVIADGHGLRLRLGQRVGYQASERDGDFVLNLSAAEPPLATGAAPANAPAADSVVVRAGRHATFHRLVFDWRRNVGYRISSEGKRIAVQFDAQGVMDGRRLRWHLPAEIRSVEPHAGGQGLRVEIALSEPRRLRHFQEGTKIVLDIMNPDPAQVTATAPAPEMPRHEGVPAPVMGAWPPAAVGDGTVEFESSRAPAAPAQSAPTQNAPTRSAQTQSAPAPARDNAGPAPARSRPDSDSPVRIRQRRMADAAEMPKYGGAPAPMMGAWPAAAVGDGTVEFGSSRAPAVPPQSAPTQDTPTRSAQTQSAPVPAAPARDNAGPAPTRNRPGSDSPVRIRPRRTAEATEIEFAWREPVPAAAFARAGNLWLIFDAAAEVTPAALTAEGDMLLHAQQLPHDEATILLLQHRPGLFARLRRERATWTLTLSPRPGGAETELTAVAQPDAPTPRLLVPILDIGRRIDAVDPTIGDVLTIVPLLPSSHGLAARREYVEFALLPTVQGIVVRPYADDLELQLQRNGVAVTSAGGLSLSPSDAKSLARSAGYASGSKGPLFDAGTWRGDEKLAFVERKQRLQHSVVSAPRNGRSAARWELAKFYIANGMAPETLANLVLIAAEDPAADDNPAFRAVRGIANFRIGRLDEAEPDLLHSDLDHHPDISAWRAALHHARHRYEEANRIFSRHGDALAQLPGAFREPLLVAWLESSVKAEDRYSYAAAQAAAEPLRESPRIGAYLALTQGWLAARNGDNEGAAEQFRRALAVGWRAVRPLAVLGLVDAELELGRIAPREALQWLEVVRYAWRGDDVEVQVLRRVAELHLALAEFRKGLARFKQIVELFPSSFSSEGVANRMAEVFETLFLEGKADELPPVQALALYSDFQELTPAGSKGDEMIRRLADRLVSVDLLDRAARLLRHQVDYRLSGAQQAEVGSRLAVIHLLDQQPESALEALRVSEAPQLAASLRQERTHIEARALAALDRLDEGLALLDADSGQAAQGLRADLLWRAERWPKAVAALEELLGESWRAEGALGVESQSQVLKLAVAYRMSDDAAGLAALARRYGAKMAAGGNAEAFKVLTEAVDPNTEFRQLAGEIAGIDTLESFMADYRAKLADSRASAVN